MAVLIFFHLPFQAGHDGSHVWEAWHVLDAIQPYANRLCLPEWRKTVIAEGEQRAKDKVEALSGDGEHDKRSTSIKDWALRKQAKQHEHIAHWEGRTHCNYWQKSAH